MSIVSPTAPPSPLERTRSEADLDTAAEIPESRRIKPRNEMIDVIRLFAAASVVLIHAAHTTEVKWLRDLVRFAVPFYLFASFYFQSLSMRHKPDRPLSLYVRERFKRLYLPFLAWSVIYLFVRDVERVALFHLEPVNLSVGMLWKGTEYHLWFLPYLLICSIVLAAIDAVLLRRNRRWRWPLITAAVIGGLVFAVVPMPDGLSDFFDNPTYAYVWWWRALPSTCWGLAFAWFMTMGPTVHSVPIVAGVAGIIMLIVCGVQQAIHGIQQIPRALSGFGCILIALAPWRATSLSMLARYGRYGYGIYLCHVLPVESMHAIFGLMHIRSSPLLDIVNFLISLVISIALVRLLARSPKTAWLNG